MQNLPLLSKGAPSEYIITPISISDIWNGAKSFFESRFRGAIICEGEVLKYGYTDMSIDGFAYFFKLLLSTIFGESTLRVKADAELNIFIIRTEWRLARDMDASEREELERIARLSGFAAEFSKDGDIYRADLKMDIKKVSHLSLYATPIAKMHEVFVRVFFLS